MEEEIRCSECGKPLKRPGKTGLCKQCFHSVPRERIAVCDFCHEEKHVYARTQAGENACRSCYRLYVNVEACADCGKVREVVKRTAAGEALCGSCVQRSKRNVCAACGHAKVTLYRTKRGEPLCQRCYRLGLTEPAPSPNGVFTFENLKAWTRVHASRPSAITHAMAELARRFEVKGEIAGTTILVKASKRAELQRVLHRFGRVSMKQ